MTEAFWSWALAALVLAIAVVLGLAVALIPYTQPLADDFCRAILEPITHLQDIYFGWSGRWFGIISSISILGFTGITENYPYLIAALFALTVLSWLIFAWALVGGRVSPGTVGAVGLLLFVLFWGGMPEPGETVYWAIGAIENHFGLFFAVVFLAFMSRAVEAENKALRSVLLMCGLISAVIATGCHEASALSMSALAVIGCAAAFYTRSDARFLWLVAAAVILVAAAFAVGAPGNLNRARFFPDSGSILRTVQMIAWGSATVVGPWFLDLKIWAASAIFLGVPGSGRFAPWWLRDTMVPWRWVAPLVTIAVLTGIFAAAGWGSGSPGPARLHNFMYALFLIGWTVTLLAWSDRIPIGLREACAGRGGAVAMTVLAAGLLTSVNTTNAIHDFARNATHDVAAWHAAIERRYEFIARAKAQGRDEIVVPAPPVHPWSFAKADLSLISGVPQNVCPARFFGLKSLGVEPRPVEFYPSKPRE